MEQPKKPLKAFEDPDREGNSRKHRSGTVCIEPSCRKTAGTAASPYWCFEHDVERMRRITRELENLANE